MIQQYIGDKLFFMDTRRIRKCWIINEYLEIKEVELFSVLVTTNDSIPYFYFDENNEIIIGNVDSEYAFNTQKEAIKKLKEIKYE